MDNNDIFLLSDKNRAYFKRIRAAIFAELHAEGIDTDNGFTVEEDALQRIAQRLTERTPKINPLATYKKAHKAATERSFMLMRADLKGVTLEEYAHLYRLGTGTEAEEERETPEEHAAFLEELRAEIERSRLFYYMGKREPQNFRALYREWFYLRSDDPSFLKTPLLSPVWPGSPAYALLSGLDDWQSAHTMRNGKKTWITQEIRAENPEYWGKEWSFTPTPEQLDALRNALGLPRYRYISLGDYTDLLFLDSFLKAIVDASPSVEIHSGDKPPIGSTAGAKRFSYIHQGTALNEYVKTQATPENITVDASGLAIIARQDFSIRLPYTLLPGLRASAYQLLDAIVRRYTENGARSPEVVLTLDEYMTARGLKDRKQAKEQARVDLAVLQASAITWEEKRGGTTDTYKFVNVADWGSIERDGRIIFTFGAKFHSVLSAYPVMPYPDFLLKINGNNNPNSYFFGRKIAEHKRMNAGKSNEDLISVDTLLSVARSIPSYERVMRGNRNITARIIEPFERDMDALAPDITWEYCHRANTPLTEDELSDMSYSLFSSLLVHVTWKDYPDQSHLIERRAAAIEAAKEPPKERKKRKK